MRANKAKLSPAFWALFTAAVTGLLVAAIYLRGEVFPFGPNSVVYRDMGQGDVAGFYRIHDVLHGKVPLLFDWNSGAGVSVTDQIGLYLNPLNLIFFLLVPREAILDSMSLYILLKLVIISLCAYAAFRRLFGLDALWHVVFSLLYTFSGYVVQYYVNPAWLDIVALFPLLVLAARLLLQEKKPLPYVALLTYCLLLNLYLSFMVYLWLLFEGIFYLLFLQKEQRARTALRLFIGSVLPLFFAAPVIVPVWYKLSQSSRYSQSDAGPFSWILYYGNLDAEKIAMLLGCALPVVLACGALRFWHTRRREVLFALVSLFLLLMPVLFDNINLFWHKGSYASFPMRFAFMLTFNLIYVAAWRLKLAPLAPPRSLPFLRFVRVGAVAAGLAVPLVVYLALRRGAYEPFSLNAVNAAVFALLLVFYACALHTGAKRLGAVFIAGMVLFECGCYGVKSLGAQHVYDVEHELGCVRAANALSQQLPWRSEGVQRVKNPDTLLGANYPFILGHSALSNWTHTIAGTLQPVMKQLGYSECYTRILDSGGTLLSDAVLGVTQTLAAFPQDASLAVPTGAAGDFVLYNNNYTLPFGMVADSRILTDFFRCTSVAQAQNKLYQSFAQDTQDILTPVEAAASTVSLREDGSAVLTLTLKEFPHSMLYFYSDCAPAQACRIYVNGRQLAIPSVARADNVVYPAFFNNGLLPLGVYDAQTVTIEIVPIVESQGQRAEFTAPFMLYALSLEKLNALTTQYSAQDTNAQVHKSELSLTVQADAPDLYAFLPVLYDPGLRCAVNGRPVELLRAFGTFVAVPLAQGENAVVIRFSPQGLSAGLWLFAAGLLLAAGCVLLCRRGGPNALGPRAERATLVLVGTGAVCILLVLYLIPAGYACVQIVRGLL